MKQASRILVRGIVAFLLIIASPLIWYDQSRKFFCLNGNCITLWKRLGGTCYIINEKYYLPFKPINKSFLQTVNWEGLSLFLNPKMPKQIIVMDREESKIEGKHFTAHNNPADGKEFVSYKEEFKPLLFLLKESGPRDITPDTNVFNIDILESNVDIVENNAIRKPELAK
jgi:hypothetical protein